MIREQKIEEAARGLIRGWRNGWEYESRLDAYLALEAALTAPPPSTQEALRCSHGVLGGCCDGCRAVVAICTKNAASPPSATPAAPCAHPADRRVGPPGLGFSVCGVCLANIPAPPPSATPNEET